MQERRVAVGIVEACGEGVEEGCAGELGEFTGCAVEGFIQGGVLCDPYVSLRCINLVWGLAISCSSGSGAGILSSMHSSIICVYLYVYTHLMIHSSVANLGSDPCTYDAAEAALYIDVNTADNDDDVFIVCKKCDTIT